MASDPLAPHVSRRVGALMVVIFAPPPIPLAIPRHAPGISLSIFSTNEFCSKPSILHMYWKLYYSTCNIACLNTTNDIANPDTENLYKNVLLCYTIRVNMLNSITYI